MAELKTQRNDNDVHEFLSQVDNEKRREDALKVLKLMEDVTGEEPALWGSSIVGFGDFHYKYESGREGDWFLTGFSPRKSSLTLYITAGFDQYDDLMSKLGKYKTGKSCLYVNKIEDVDMDVLRELVKQSVEHMKASNSE